MTHKNTDSLSQWKGWSRGKLQWFINNKDSLSEWKGLCFGKLQWFVAPGHSRVVERHAV